MHSSRVLEAVLVAALQQREPPPSVDTFPGETIVTAADRHRISPAVYLCLRDRQIDPRLLDALRVRYNDQLMRHLTSSADLGLVQTVLTKLGLGWAVMKGPILADLLWPRPDMRQYFDLDVVVERGGFEAAIAGLVAAGTRLIDVNWPLICEQRRGELSLQLPYGTYLDLHWHLVNDPTVRAELRLPVDSILERVRTVQVGGLDVPTFDQVDTLLTLALHAVHAGATRLVWLKDVERAAAQPGLDWAEVHRRTRALGLEIALTVALRRAWRALGVGEGHAGWRPARGVWPFAAMVADRLVDNPTLSETQHTAQLLYRSVRRTSWDSTRATWRQLRHPPPALVGESNPLHISVDDAAAQQRFFADVRS